MAQFTVARVRGMKRRTQGLVAQCLDACAGSRRFDLVDDLAYPLPVTVICELLGVPREDEPRFHAWATQLATALEPESRNDPDLRARNTETFDAIADYMRDLIREKRRAPADDMLSGLATAKDPQAGRMSDPDLIATAILLLIAGHETTVNLITNGMLTLLRHPDELARLRTDPERAPRVIEELLRYEPPVHFRTRIARAPIPIAGTVILRARRWCCCLPPATAIRPASPTPSGSIRTGPTTSISASAAPCITVSARRSPGSRPRPL